MQRIAQFFKVSFNQFCADYSDTFSYISKDELVKIYDNLTLPSRATVGSAGYDFVTPVEITLKPKQCIKIPTGIRVKMEPGWMLQCYPKSGLGTKFRMQLDNTVGIIDSDYFYAKNEGHIIIKITNDSNEDKTLKIDAGKAFFQAIFVEYGITVDDNATDQRVGGFGSTQK